MRLEGIIFSMLNKLSYPIVLLLFFAFACKKSDQELPGANASPDDCVTQNAFESGDVIEGKYIVIYNDQPGNIDNDRVLALGKNALRRHSISTNALEKSFPGKPGGFVARLSREEVNRLRTDSGIAAIEPDRIVKLNTCFTVVEPRLITWNIEKVGYGDGAGKRAWVIDTGIDFDHPDLNVDKTRSKSFINGETSADDENGHGTHVAGIIGALNNRIGVLGVASGASLVSLRVLDKEGTGNLSYIIQALSYINANAKPGDVVNMSVGDEEGISEILDQQVKNTAAKGIFFAIAAGNEGEPAVNYSPGRANGTNIYTVSAVDSLGNFAKFSNYGNDAVDFAAPGVRILSSYIGGKYAYMSGTSMAAPHMAGLLLLRGNNVSNSGAAKNDPDGNADLIAHY
jgi:subtilisin